MKDIYKLEIKNKSRVFSERYVKGRKKEREDKRKKKKKKEKKEEGKIIVIIVLTISKPILSVK